VNINGTDVTATPSRLDFDAPPRAVDADGARTAYAPHGSGLSALDALANALRDPEGDWPLVQRGEKPAHGWAGVVCDGNGDPVVVDGHYVSQTALSDHGLPVADPNRYVQSDVVCYISGPPELFAAGVREGDVGTVTLGEYTCAFVVADLSPRHARMVEVSIALARALRIPASAINGGSERVAHWTIFLGSAPTPAWPRTMDEIAADARTLAQAAPGSC
jgi:hypothetical protein